MVKNPPDDAGDVVDVGLIPGSRISPGLGSGNSLQYFCLENLVDRGMWWATVPTTLFPWGCKESDMTEHSC